MGDSLRCIFCLQERAPSEEHVYPLAIGGTLVIQRVCEPCNSRLGSEVDSKLTDHLLILTRREELDLRGNSGKPISALQQMMKGSAVLANDPQQRVKLITDPVTGRLVPELLYQRTTGADGSVRVRVDARNRKSIQRIVESELKRMKAGTALSGEVKPIDHFVVEEGVIENPEITFNPEIDFHEYQFAIAKIAYELAWYWLGDPWLDDPGCTSLRSYIGRRGAMVRGAIQIGLAGSPLRLWPERDHHVGFVRADGGFVFIGIKIFDLIWGMVVVSERPESYTIDENSNFMSIDARSRSVRARGWEEALLDVIKAPSTWA